MSFDAKRLRYWICAMLVCLVYSRSGWVRAEDTPVVQLPAVSVTGSNIHSPEQQRLLPLTTVDAGQIELIGALSVGDLLKTLPEADISLNSIGPTASGPNDAGGDAGSVNLRGLGDGNTLTLINGRRLSAYGVAPGTPPVVFVNVNEIPVAAIDHIEVLRDSASAIYGSDATGGVVNFIMKRDFEGTEINVRADGATGGYEELSASVALGRRLDDGKSNLSLIVSYYKRDGLDASDRWFSANSNKIGITAAPFNSSVVNTASSSGPYGRFSQILSYNADGTIGASNSFFVQAAPGGTGVTIVPGTGPTLTFNSQGTRKLVADVKRANVFATFDRALSEHVSLFAETSFYDARSYTTIGQVPTSGNVALTGADNVIVPASNYYNPYGVRLNPTNPSDVLIRNYRPVELGARTFNVKIDAVRLIGGLKGHWGDTWQWEASGGYMESVTIDDQGNLLSQSEWTAELALNTPNAFNVFGGPNVNSPAVLAQSRIVDWMKGEGQLALVDAKASGDVADLWGGPLSLALGAEFRNEEIKETNSPFGLADDVISISQQINATAERNVYAGYTEVLAPLIGPRNRLPILYAFDLSAAGRYENFGKFSAANPKVGFGLTIVPSLNIRGSYSEGFRAPSVLELFQPARGRRDAGYIDTARVYTTNGIAVTPEDAASGTTKDIITGGNPGLVPENSRAWNLGTELRVPTIKELTFGLDFWGIRQVNRIAAPDPQLELNEDATAWHTGHGSNPNVVRAPQTAADVAANIPGVLVSVNGTYENADTRETAGLDLSGNYELRIGSGDRVTMHAEASRFLKLRDIAAVGTITDLMGNSLHPLWRGASSVSWAHAKWTTGIFVRYVGSYDGSPALITNGAVYREASWTSFNVAVGRKFSLGAVKGLALRVGANNVFNRAPPLDPSLGDGYNEANADPFGRVLFVEVRRSY